MTSLAPPPPAPPLTYVRPRPYPPARQRHGALWVLLIAALVIGVVAVVARTPRTVPGEGHVFANPAYVPALGRNAEWTTPTAGLSDDALQSIATNSGIFVMPKFAYDYDLEQHFAAARTVARDARAVGNPIKIFDYFNASFWITKNETGWGPYAATFNDDWLLRDDRGQPIPFYGVGKRHEDGAPPVGYMLDLTNPDYRRWAVATIVSWMRAAPYSGIAFDSANPLIADTMRGSVGTGERLTYNQMLCGTDVVPGLACSRVDDWNSGLTNLLSETTSALNKMGDEVIYNGIAPSALRGASRNIALLAHTDITTNEAFCLSPSARDPSNVEFESITADADLMRSIARQGKQVLEVTNYQAAEKREYGDYCLGGFLIGWQPGSSRFIFHSGYGDPLGNGYPVVPEQNLALGKPSEPGYEKRGDVLSRSFQHGFVVVNTGDSPAEVELPVAGVQFSGGVSTGVHRAGEHVVLDPHDAFFLLSREYLWDR